MNARFEKLLSDLAVMAPQRQRDRGVHPTNWYGQWMTLLSITMANHAAKAILDTTPYAERPCVAIPVVGAT